MDGHAGWMKMALKEAEKALSRMEVPVGAVVVYKNKIVGRGYNQVESLQDPTAHAEMIALSAAANTLDSWRLEDCMLYVTLEPCAMCAGAIVLSRIDRVVYGATDPKTGACGSLRNILQDHRLNHQVPIISGVMELDCSLILKSFFNKLRESQISD